MWANLYNLTLLLQQMQIFHEKNDEKVCKLEDDTIDGEDVEIGKCLRNLNVTAEDSRDSQQRERFLPFMPEKHLSPSGNGDAWYRGAIFYPPKQASSHRKTGY